MLTATHLNRLIRELPARVRRGDDVTQLAKTIEAQLSAIEVQDAWTLVEHLGTPPPELIGIVLALAEQCERQLDDHRRLHTHIAGRLRHLERPAEAIKKLEPYIAPLRATEIHTADEIKLLVTYAACLSDHGDVRPALEISNHAKSLAEAQYPTEHLLRATVLLSVVTHLWLNRKVHRAIAETERLLEILDNCASDQDSFPLHLEALMKLPLLHFEAGDIEQATKTLHQTINVIAELDPELLRLNEAALAHFFNNAGIVAAESVQPHAAIDIFAEAGRRYHALTAIDQNFEIDLASLLMNEARLLRQLDKPGSRQRIDTAVKLLREHHQRIRSDSTRLELALALRTRSLVSQSSEGPSAWRDARAAEYLIRSTRDALSNPTLETLIRIIHQKLLWAPDLRKLKAEQQLNSLMALLEDSRRLLLEGELKEALRTSQIDR